MSGEARKKKEVETLIVEPTSRFATPLEEFEHRLRCELNANFMRFELTTQQLQVQVKGLESRIVTLESRLGGT